MDPAAPELSDEQRAVVEAPPGVTLVVAGAGSGKTRVLTARVARLLMAGAAPASIVLATFTHRAAEEMCLRVERATRVGTRGRGRDALWAGTFHQLGVRALRRFGPRIGLRADFQVLDRDDAQALLGQALDEERGRGLPMAPLAQQILSRAAGSGLTLHDALAALSPRHLPQAQALGRAATRFQRRKAELGRCDFDDLLVLWKLLLDEREDVRAELGAEIRHVLVDEYQDVSPIQAELCERLAAAGGADLMVVGDDAQSIYRFRGADLGRMLDFPRRFPEARSLRLEDNYRSTPEILALAERSIAHNPRRFEKALRARRPSGPRPVEVVAPDPVAQARFVAHRAAELRAAGVPLAEIAVLYRAHAHAVEVQLELARAGLGFRVRSGPRLTEQAHVKDALAFLRVLLEPGDTLAWVRLLGLCAGVGAATGATLAGALASGQSLRSTGKRLSRAALRALESVLRVVEELDSAASPGALLRTVLDRHYRAWAEHAFDDAGARLAELDELAAWGASSPDLRSFLSDVALAGAVEPAGDGAGALTLSTIHRAKGLEWACVFVIGLTDGQFPPSVTLRGGDDEQEERRLFHVAVTRARDQLYLCRAEHAVGVEGYRMRLLRSRFLDEVAGVCDAWRVEDRPGEAAGTQRPA